MLQKYIICGVVHILGLCSSAPVGSSYATEDLGVWSFTNVLTAVLSLAGLLCLIKVLTLCSEFCQKRQIFQEFQDTDNDNVFNPDLNPISPIAPEFSMVPPTENTPDTIAATSSPIVFEPLPDLNQIKQPAPQVANTVQLRPKVAVVPQDDGEDLDDIIQRHDPSQDKAKLQTLLANAKTQVPREQVSYIKELGSGWFGKVLQGEGHSILPGHKKTKIVVQMLKEDADVSEQLAFLMEATPYRDIDHRNVLKLLGQCVDTAPYLTVLELCPFGDLKTYLRSHRVAIDSFNEKGLLLKFASDMAAGLQALHEVHFVHRDFAARNCLLSSDLTVKIGDYGLGDDTFKEDYLFDSGGCGLPIRWLAPECVSIQENGEVGLRGITVHCNVWSFGISLWEVITFGNLPYGDLSNEHVLRLVVKERSLVPNKPDVKITHIDRLYELMQLCWSAPATRPSIRELRIMLLHLLSHKITTHNTEAFETKWNKLLPRRQPQVVKVAPDIPAASIPEPSTSNHVLINGAIKTVATSDIMMGGGAVPYSEPGDFLITKSLEPPEGLAKLDVSALEGAEPHQGLSLEEELALVHRSQPVGGELTSPVNELSLAAELSDLQRGQHSEELTPVNEKSEDDDVDLLFGDEEIKPENVVNIPVKEKMKIDEEGKISSSVVSEGVGLDQDDILIFDTNGVQVKEGEEEGKEKSTETSDEKTEVIVEMEDSIDPPPVVVVKVTDFDRLRGEEEGSPMGTPGKSDSIIAQARGIGAVGTPARDISDFNFKSPEAQFDVVTSTPKKGEGEDMSSLPTNPMAGLSELHGNSDYYTALSAQISTDSTNSTPSLPSTSTDDRSFLGEKKFAAMLQTVVTSFDNEDADLLSPSLGEMSFDAIPEEVFLEKDRDLNATPTGDSLDLLSDLPEEKEKTADEDTFIMDPGEQEGEGGVDGEGVKNTEAADSFLLLDLGDENDEKKARTEEGGS